MVGDGEEATLTAYALAQERVIQQYKYQIYLIQGGHGVKTELKHATEEDLTPGFSWMPLKKVRFALNFLLKDNFRSKVFERHFFKYFQYRYLTPSNDIKKILTREIAIDDLANVDINQTSKQLVINNGEKRELKEYLRTELKSEVTIVKG